MNIEFIMEEAPQHGAIKYLDEEDGLVTFTWEDVSANNTQHFTIIYIELVIYYINIWISFIFVFSFHFNVSFSHFIICFVNFY